MNFLVSFFTEGVVNPEGRLDKLLHGRVRHVGVHARLPLVALKAVAHEAHEVKLVKVLVIADKRGPALPPAGVLGRVTPRADLARLWSPVPDIASLELGPQLPNTILSGNKRYVQEN